MSRQPRQQEPEVGGAASSLLELLQRAAEKATPAFSVGAPPDAFSQPGQGSRTDTATAAGAPAGGCQESTRIRQQDLHTAVDDAPAVNGAVGAAGACCTTPSATIADVEPCSVDNPRVRAQPAMPDVVGPTACGPPGDSNKAEAPSKEDRAEVPQSPNPQLRKVAQHAAPGPDAAHPAASSAAGALEAAALEQAMTREQAIAMCKEFEAFAAPSRGLSSVAQALAAVLGAAEGAVIMGAALPPPLATAMVDAAISLLAAATQWQASSASRD